MRKTLVLVLFFCVFTACSSNDSFIGNTNRTSHVNRSDKSQENEIIFSENKPDNTMQKINKLINDYQINLVESINNNTFSIVEPNLLTNSNLYVSQKKLINNLFNRKITEKFISSYIYRVYYTDVNKYDVEATENIAINYPQKQGTSKEFHWIYSVEKVGETYFLSDIREWPNFKQDIEQRMGAVKTDGFYADELLGFYPKVLEDCLNTLDITEIKRISANDSVLKNIKSLMTSLLHKGSNFSVQMTILDYGELNYIYNVEFTISYTNKKDRKEIFTGNYQIELDEIRDEVTYDGYAVIKNIKELTDYKRGKR
ncbi:hypothetical protein [Paenibacillus sp. P32E]|uniref:TcaA NTF2-like domain-containing protein n=1 Tax=Paenibacillus sp. P32E TaxID=1349434 RepID=UPI0009397A8F|nr:hypothetical protein [Paenibacillus sp. P32E]OKP92973.1 hypothetical protein A3848_06240 [Paenibacillus sp. P32E]